MKKQNPEQPSLEQHLQLWAADLHTSSECKPQDYDRIMSLILKSEDSKSDECATNAPKSKVITSLSFGLSTISYAIRTAFILSPILVA